MTIPGTSERELSYFEEHTEQFGEANKVATASIPYEPLPVEDLVNYPRLFVSGAREKSVYSAVTVLSTGLI